MAFRGILPEVPSFAAELARGLGAGLGKGISQASKMALQLMSERRNTTAKNISKFPETVQRYLKSKGYGKNYAQQPDKLTQITELTKPLIEQGIDPIDALESVFPGLLSEWQKPGESFLSKAKKFFTGAGDVSPDSALIKGVGGDGRPDIAAKIAPASAARAAELAPGLGVPALLAGLAQRKGMGLTPSELLSKKMPLRSAQDILTGANLPEKSEGKYFRLPSEMIAEKLMEGMTPEERQKAEESMAVQSMVAAPFAQKGIEKGKAFLQRGKAISPTEILPAERAQIGFEPRAAEEISKEKPSIAGRVSKEVGETPTEMRIARTEPETKIYNRLENVKLREQQVKLFPQYETEISKDAAERAAREEARRPKTAIGEASQAVRIAEAEKSLPAVRKAYENSIGRVRALEDEVAKLVGTQKETAETLLELAQRDLENAEFELIQTLNNAKTGERRTGIPQMEQAAQQKLIKIGDMAAEGEEIKLAKMDYSPDLIAEAKRLEKIKKLPARKTNDFYTIVHDTYANQYRTRLAQVEKEITDAMKGKRMSDVQRVHQLQKEKDALNKIIKSAEAENTIHRHKIALREISNRHMAQERFAKLKRVEGGERVSETARQKMWKERLEEAKTPQESAQVIDEAAEQASAENPKNAEQVGKEKKGLKEAFDKIREKHEKVDPGTIKGAPNAKEAGTRAKGRMDKLLNEINQLRSSFPYIWKTKAGKDLITGISTVLVDELLDLLGIDLPTGSSTLFAAIMGRPYGSAFRVMGNLAAKAAIREWKVNKAEEAFRKGSPEFSQYAPSIKKRAQARY